MNKIVSTVLFAGLYLIGSGALAASLKIKADHAKYNDTPWDGIGGSSGGVGIFRTGLPTAGAPDLKLCTLYPSGESQCFFRVEKKKGFFSGKERVKHYSYCQNSDECRFELDFSSFPVGIVIVDIDVESDDLVDAFVLTDATNKSDIKRLDSHLRAYANSLAPAYSNGEKQRRRRPFPTCVVNKSKVTKCRLRQSSIHLSN
ncbi:hypothetical protein [Vibrio quintilis]|uniref:Uncharacterized protein n=1 Tax=Vibrio quintilis TaxID=1117707 RepID=A0A1M7YWT1_9VIBR|nr:hypothetical protein [Vibrio quintilis]SHO57042.1 hypothetical protein VQ7734_02811 [Vibrio quintilis]